MTDYLTVAEVLAIHEDLIARYGGTPGIRDLGLLEAAVFRPQTGYYADLIAEAAALWESLSQNHPFVDGNNLSMTSTSREGLTSTKLSHGSERIRPPIQTEISIDTKPKGPVRTRPRAPAHNQRLLV